MFFSKGSHRFAEGRGWPRLKWQYIVGGAIATCAIFASTFVAASASLEDGSGGDTGGYGQHCAGVPSVLFIGVRGSGEFSWENNGYGPEIDRIRAAFVAALPRGVTHKEVALNYTAASVTDLLIPFVGASRYFNSIQGGETMLINTLYDARATCSSQKIVVAGFSQGALVVNQAIRNFDFPDQVKNITLLADPARVPDQVGAALGTARPGYGIYDTVYPVTRLPADLGPATNSFCDSGDVVCDSSHGAGAVGVATHMSYWVRDSGGLAALGRRAASV